MRTFALLAACAVSLLAVLPARAQLMVHPTRIVMEARDRAGQVEIINGSDEPATYRIGIVDRRMSEYGHFTEVDTPLPGEQFAGPMLRYSPRRVTLAPGASQVIRIMVRRPADLADGEYRSHLLFSKQPDPVIERQAAEQAGTGGIGVALTALIGVSIPVIVRQGDTSADVVLGGLEFATPPAATSPVLSLEMRRSGNQSVYGDLVVTFTPAGRQPVEVGRAGGVAVYTPNPLRRVRLPLTPPPGMSLADGTLTVSYRERAEEGGAVLAESSLALP